MERVDVEYTRIEGGENVGGRQVASGVAKAGCVHDPQAVAADSAGHSRCRSDVTTGGGWTGWAVVHYYAVLKKNATTRPRPASIPLDTRGVLDQNAILTEGPHFR